jgi:hypothetical protein
VRVATLVPTIGEVVLEMGAFIVVIHPLLVELDVERDMGTGSLVTAGLEVVQECRCPIGDLMVLEVPERVEQGVWIAVLSEADAQVMLDRVAPADGDVMVVVPIPVSPDQRTDS